MKPLNTVDLCRGNELASNKDALPGFPAVYFSQVDQFQSRRTYCDADIALRDELGVKPAFPPDSNAVDN